MMANDFLVYHEVGHILGGHLDLHTDGRGRAIKQEVHHDAPQNVLEEHALELLADEAPFILTPLWRNARDLPAWTMAVTILTIILNEGRDFERGYYVGTHPHPAMRLRHAAVSALRVAPELKALTARAWPETLANCSPLIGLSSFLGLLSGEEGDAMYDELFKCMMKLLTTGKAADIPVMSPEDHAGLVRDYEK